LDLVIWDDFGCGNAGEARMLILQGCKEMMTKIVDNYVITMLALCFFTVDDVYFSNILLGRDS